MITVCMATYNGRPYVEEQIESILRQLDENDQLIISDDRSTDGTAEFLGTLRDPRIEVVSNASNHGVNGNFQNALTLARGEYIFLADQDDVWLPGKVKACVEALQNADVVVHDAIITDSDLRPNNNTLFSELKIKEGFWPNLIRNRFTGCCMAMRREVLEYVLPLPYDRTFFHDNWIGLMVSLRGKVKFLPYKGIYFRRHEATKSVSGKGKDLPLQQKIAYRARLMREILKRNIKTGLAKTDK